jgi:hypothetical protein
MQERILEDFASRANRMQTDAVIGLIVGVACCSPVGLYLSLRAMNMASGLLIEIQHSNIGLEYKNSASTARTIGLLGVILSSIFGAALVIRLLVYFATQLNA